MALEKADTHGHFSRTSRVRRGAWPWVKGGDPLGKIVSGAVEDTKEQGYLDERGKEGEAWPILQIG